MNRGKQSLALLLALSLALTAPLLGSALDTEGQEGSDGGVDGFLIEDLPDFSDGLELNGSPPEAETPPPEQPSEPTQQPLPESPEPEATAPEDPEQAAVQNEAVSAALSATPTETPQQNTAPSSGSRMIAAAVIVVSLALCALAFLTLRKKNRKQ